MYAIINKTEMMSYRWVKIADAVSIMFNRYLHWLWNTGDDKFGMEYKKNT